MTNSYPDKTKASNLIFVGNLVSLKDSMQNFGFSQAGILLQIKFIDFVKPNKIIALLPLFYRGGKRLEFHTPISFIKNQSIFNGKINYLYRLIFDTCQVLVLILRENSKNVFFYNIDFQNLFIIMASKFLFRKNVFVMVADYAYFSSGSVSRVFKWVLWNLNGVLVLNSNICVNKNSRLLLGLLYREQVILNSSGLLNKKIIIGGSLGKTTGLELALSFFSKKSELTLYVAGRPFRYKEGEMEGLIESYQKRFLNIIYLGHLDHDEYMKVLNKCDVALSLRDPADDEHNYNFPSKILEYLSLSKMVVSTKRYPDVKQGVLFYSDFTEVALEECFKEIYAMSENEVKMRRLAIYDYLVDGFTEQRAVNIVEELIS